MSEAIRSIPISPTPETKFLIIGAGCFGLSTAYHLLKRGYKRVHVVDRAPQVPAVDAASTDLNKIVRSAYEDKFYCHLARSAIAEWKKKEIWGDIYSEAGFAILNPDTTTYGDLSYQNDLEAGARIRKLLSDEEIQGEGCVFPPNVELGKLVKAPLVINEDGGWAAAADGVGKCIELVKELGGEITVGKTAKGCLRGEGGKVTGVIFEDETTILADIIIIAAGSWTASSFKDLDLAKHVFASGQGLATIQLTSEEADRYRTCPVVLAHDSGFYMFPPNKDNIIKISAHGAGYTHIPPPSSDKDERNSNPVSTPRTLLSDGPDGLRIPKEMVRHFRDILSEIYPELGRKDFASTRLCWYTYTADSDWVIDTIQSDENVFIASGGSGHGYKFLPVIGSLVADRVERKLPPDLVAKFSTKRDRGEFVNWGWFTHPRDLQGVEMCTEHDLIVRKGTI